ncbi:MAG: hypothetical protein V1787_03400 [Candidatus Micrarchaeota archaeon]
MVDWVSSWQLIFDEYLLWLVVGAMLLYILWQNYALEGWQLAFLVFAVFLGAMMMKVQPIHITH